MFLAQPRVTPGHQTAAHMCDIDIETGRPVGTSRTVRARRGWTCCACGEGICEGTEYRCHSGLYDGSWSYDRQCMRCWGMWWAIAIKADEPVAYALDCGSTWRDAFGEDPPPEVAALAFALPAELEAVRSLFGGDS
jgi:hypothetical protein